MIMEEGGGASYISDQQDNDGYVSQTQHHHHLHLHSSTKTVTSLQSNTPDLLIPLSTRSSSAGMSGRKKLRTVSHETYRSTPPEPDVISELPDDIVLLILTKLSASASTVSDFVCLLVTCKRLNRLAMSAAVLRELSGEAMAVKARSWSESSHRFLRLCVQSGNVEAHYVLGMIRFYCIGNRSCGMSLLAKAAMRNHAPSLYSLALIHFNASGKSKGEKDLESGVALCARAAYLGSIDALRELAHSLLDGYGVRRDVSRGRRLLLQAALLELQASKVSGSLAALHRPDAAHRFMRQWFETRRISTASACSGDRNSAGDGDGSVGLRLCSNEVCGRIETRANEFRRCSVCSSVNYCSRACQALHWRSRHKDVCAPNGEALDVAEVAEGGGPADAANVDFNGGFNVG
uniref:MYND-type domain-containing protein n=1 Tax=Kalanchoe fedtschenkoi TaxID=63787 RepID=A0A7N0RAH5_KALFE